MIHIIIYNRFLCFLLKQKLLLINILLFYNLDYKIELSSVLGKIKTFVIYSVLLDQKF